MGGERKEIAVSSGWKSFQIQLAHTKLIKNKFRKFFTLSSQASLVVEKFFVQEKEEKLGVRHDEH